MPVVATVCIRTEVDVVFASLGNHVVGLCTTFRIPYIIIILNLQRIAFCQSQCDHVLNSAFSGFVESHLVLVAWSPIVHGTNHEVCGLNGCWELYETEVRERHPVVYFLGHTLYADGDSAVICELELKRCVVPTAVEQTTSSTKSRHASCIVASKERELNSFRCTALNGEHVLTSGQGNILLQGNIPCIGTPVTTVEVLVLSNTSTVCPRLIALHVNVAARTFTQNNCPVVDTVLSLRVLDRFSHNLSTLNSLKHCV